jgi:hypothetical protein
MIEGKSSAPEGGAHPSPAKPEHRDCFACYGGWVYIGHMVEDENGEEVEVIEPVPCRRCQGARGA